MALWKIQPTAAANDPRWQDHIQWRLVIVQADTFIQAVVTASDELRRHVQQVGNESKTCRTGLEDEKLYWITSMEKSNLPAEALDDPTSPKVLLALPMHPEHERFGMRSKMVSHD